MPLQTGHRELTSRKQRVNSQPSLNKIPYFSQAAPPNGSTTSPNGATTQDQVFKYSSLWGTNFSFTTALYPLKAILDLGLI